MPTLIRVTRSFDLEMAHALTGYDGPCKNIHGHSYQLKITLSGTPLQKKNSPKDGMVIDFSDIKKIVVKTIIRHFDHALVLNKNSPFRKFIKVKKEFPKIIYSDYQPTSENLLIDFVTRLKRSFPKNITLHHVTLRETARSKAEWFAEDNLKDA